MNIAEKAIKNKEIRLLLEGKNGYKLENHQWADIDSPIDWTRVVPMIYGVYQKEHSISIKEDYETALKEMFSGDAESVYCAMAVLYFQILCEESGKSPFAVNRKGLLEIAHNKILENEENIKSTKKWAGLNNPDGLWSEVERYRRLLKAKFGIVL